MLSVSVLQGLRSRATTVRVLASPRVHRRAVETSQCTESRGAKTRCSRSRRLCFSRFIPLCHLHQINVKTISQSRHHNTFSFVLEPPTLIDGIFIIADSTQPSGKGRQPPGRIKHESGRSENTGVVSEDTRCRCGMWGVGFLRSSL